MKKRTGKGRRAMQLVSTRKALATWQAFVCDELTKEVEYITHEWLHFFYARKHNFYLPNLKPTKLEKIGVACFDLAADTVINSVMNDYYEKWNECPGIPKLG
jgi:hypothetical protein